MQPPSSARSPEPQPSSQDLPYGPLPIRREPGTDESEQQPLDQLVDLSWLALGNGPPPEPEGSSDEPPRGEESRQNGVSDDAEHADDPDAGEEEAGTDPQEPAGGLSLTSPRPDADDDVHFGVAARALGVSRKTVERMVKRGQLERGPSNAPATVSKRSLVATLEARRRDVTDLTRATEIEQSQPSDQHPAMPSPHAAASALNELVPVLAPLIDEFVEARTRAAVLETELKRLRARAGQDRARDELLLALATTGWWGRRKTRRAVLRQYVLGEHSDSNSSGE